MPGNVSSKPHFSNDDVERDEGDVDRDHQGAEDHPEQYIVQRKFFLGEGVTGERIEENVPQGDGEGDGEGY